MAGGLGDRKMERFVVLVETGGVVSLDAIRAGEG